MAWLGKATDRLAFWWLRKRGIYIITEVNGTTLTVASADVFRAGMALQITDK
jgi:hypothetical protein